MTTQPNILDADRLTTYMPNNAAGPFDIGFPIFDNTGADLTVELNGVKQEGNWTLEATPLPGFWGAPNTYIGTITFAEPITGRLVIEGTRSPRRVSQYAEGRGIPARDQNTEWNILTAIAREFFQRLKRTLTAPASDAPIDMTLPGKAARANNILEFNAQGLPVATRSVPDLKNWTERSEAARDAAREYRDEAEGHRNIAAQWAQNPHGQPVEGTTDGYSGLHWATEAHAHETAAATYAAMAGAQVFDFGTLDQTPEGVDDWGTL